MEIDKNAPAVSHAEIEVAASPEIVWAVLTDIGHWPSWNPEVKQASLSGPFAPGVQFRWKAGPGTITSTLESVEPPKVIAWTGKTVGIEAIHVYRLEPQGSNTIVKSAESWRLDRPALPWPDDQDIAEINRVRAAVSEDRSRAPRSERPQLPRTGLSVLGAGMSDARTPG